MTQRKLTICRTPAPAGGARLRIGVLASVLVLVGVVSPAVGQHDQREAEAIDAALHTARHRLERCKRRRGDSLERAGSRHCLR